MIEDVPGDGSAYELGVRPSRTYDALTRVLSVAHLVTQPVLLDAENVPASGPFLLVGNHTLLGVQDVPALVHELEKRRGVRVRGLGDHAHYLVPGWRDLLDRLGVIRGTRENCAALLDAGEGVLVYPGGAREVFKRRDQAYELLWGDRTGFARMAIEAGCPIVPFAGIGAEDRFKVVFDMDHKLAAPARAIAGLVGRDDVGTLWIRGTGPAMLPKPERLYFRFGEPIDTTAWAGRHKDAAARDECRDLVKSSVEEQIRYLLAHRADDPERGLMRRAAGALRRAV